MLMAAQAVAGGGAPAPSGPMMVRLTGADMSKATFGDIGDFSADATVGMWAVVYDEGYRETGGDTPLMIKRIAGSTGWYVGANINAAYASIPVAASRITSGTDAGGLGYVFPVYRLIYLAMRYTHASRTLEYLMDGVVRQTYSLGAGAGPVNTEALKVGADADDQKFAIMDFGDLAVWSSAVSTPNLATIAAARVGVADYPVTPDNFMAVGSSSITDSIGSAVATLAADAAFVAAHNGTPTYSGTRYGKFSGTQTIALSNFMDQATFATPFCLEFRLARVPDGSTDTIVSKCAATGNTSPGIEVWAQGAAGIGNRIGLKIKSTSSARIVNVLCDGFVVDGINTHVLINWTGTTASFYYDGALQTHTTTTNNPDPLFFPTNAEPWRIGSTGLTGNRLNGNLFEFYMHDRALTSGEIAEAASTGNPLARTKIPTHAYEIGALEDVALGVTGEATIYDLIRDAPQDSTSLTVAMVLPPRTNL